jgi:two-component system LytT family sensor kinase
MSLHIKQKRLLPIKSLLWFLLGASAIIQCAILSYRHLTGLFPIEDAVTFFAAIMLNSLICTFAGFILAIPDLYVIKKLNKQFEWGERTASRICVQLVMGIIIAVIVSTLITLLFELIVGYKEPVIDVLIRNGLIFPAVNILLMAVFEGWMFFMQNRLNKERAEALSRELLEIRFEVLKNQIDPHFMFNNLNVLSALIDSNPTKAQHFIEEFSDLYRYILDTIEKPVVTVAQELTFIKSYIFLQQMRHGEAIILLDAIPEDIYEAHVPPFSLQIVIENAIKHNVSDTHKPLKIELAYVNGCIEVKNNIQTPISSIPSTGLGQNNLIKRYRLISDMLPVFEAVEGIYIVTIPLIKEKNNI